MNKKAENFKAYLKKQKVTCFAIDEIKNDAMNTVAFRSYMDVAGRRLETLVLCDSTIYTMIRVRVFPKALSAKNEAKLRKQIDMLNGTYKILKFYLSPEGDLVLDVTIPAPAGTVDGDMIFTMMDVIIRNLETEYEKLAEVIGR